MMKHPPPECNLQTRNSLALHCHRCFGDSWRSYRCCRSPDCEFTEQSDPCQNRCRVERHLIIVVLVIQQTTDASPEETGHAPGGEEHPVIDAHVLGAPEVGSSCGVDRKLGAVAPVNDEQHHEQR